ncbi:ROK family protein [Streptomyces sp. NBC_00893]|uniref:ROK family protein n=1 Tax=Streptomyces sp. NBC_00893 TaxID=2975862 RepID=UPI00224DBFE6|nr:ROK family protein [Streptomyces sp. NBC_00893]MCX4851540.1 ROK family protein [Streptomyces sp. NBC_00893]
MAHLGIDVGGTKVALRLESGTDVRWETAFRWPPGPDAGADLDRLGAALREACRHSPDPLRAVGVAMPGVLDPADRIVAWPSRPWWADVDLRSFFDRALPDAEVRYADDGDLAALAEARAAGLDNLLYVGVGTGIGGGAVVHGDMFPGTGRGSFEIGHTVVDMAGAVCVCGRVGCVQALASGPATLRRAADVRGTSTSFEEFVSALLDAEEWATQALRVSAAALATAVVGAGELLHPSAVVIGGGFAEAVPGFADQVAAQMSLLARPGVPLPSVGPAALGGLSSLYGAVGLARTAADARTSGLSS